MPEKGVKRMKGLLITAAVLGTFAGLSYLNYRRFVPKPRAMSIVPVPVDLEAEAKHRNVF